MKGIKENERNKVVFKKDTREVLDAKHEKAKRYIQNVDLSKLKHSQKA